MPRYAGTTLAFVSTHLTAHEGVAYCAMRNDSIKEILGGVRVGDERFDVSNQKHHIFWMGDMNYRTCFDSETPPRSKRDENLTPAEEENRKRMLESSMKVGADDEEVASPDGKGEKISKKAKVTKQVGIVVPQIKDNAFADIVARDELNREIAGNRALLLRLQPAFPPTFKRKRQVGLSKKGISGSLKTALARWRNGPPSSMTRSARLATQIASYIAQCPTLRRTALR